MTDSNERPNAPYGLSALHSVSKPLFWFAALAGVASLASSLSLAGAGRGLVILSGVLLLDFGQEGIRQDVVRFFHLRWRPLLLAGCVLLALAYGSTIFQLWLSKRDVLRGSKVLGKLTVRETDGVDRNRDLVVLPLDGVDRSKLQGLSADSKARLTVYDGLRRLQSNLAESTTLLVVEVSLRAHEEKQLELYRTDLGAAPDSADDEESWTAEGAYTRMVHTLQFSARREGERDGVVPILGRSYLEIEVVPMPGRMPYVWIGLPVAGPAKLSEQSALLYALRTEEAAGLDASVQLQTSAGYLYQSPAADQNGLLNVAASEVQTRSSKHWYVRRIPLKHFAGARLERVGLMIQHPEGWPDPSRQVMELDAVRVVEGGPLEARLVLEP